MASSGDSPTTRASDQSQPPFDLGRDSTVTSPWQAATDHPTQIGPYRILSVLGQGGMGVVYSAEQRAPVHRQVAIKVIKLGMDTRDVVARFEAERQALAMMDHPNVARVIEAGATDSGRPYFVMDLVKGEPLTAYCDSQNLSTRARLELFAVVCDAVQHAHMKGIIHRDLKPSNVLVAQIDGTPIPKIIDFGVSKAVSHRLTEQTLYTQTGSMVGTVEYMSPEQAETGTMDVDTRSDVYSLGVMLYEVLSGMLPFDANVLRAAAFEQKQRIIREVDPPRPSTRFRALGAASAARLAQARQESVESLTRSLSRELDWIPLKAIRKERDARYSTASELAEDIRNYLQGQPLRAAPESRAYRVRKFLRRNRRAVAAAGAMLLLLLAGIVGTTLQAVRATRAERLARAQQTEAEQRFQDVRSLANRLLLELHPDIASLAGSSRATRKLVDISLEYLRKLSARTSRDPQLLREISVGYAKLGDIQGNALKTNLGDVAAARTSYELSRDTAARALAIAPNDPLARTALATAMMSLADLQLSSDNPREALDGYRAAQSMMEDIARTAPNDFQAQYNALLAPRRMQEAFFDLGDVAAAVSTARKQLDACKGLAARFSDQAETKSLLVDAHMGLGRVMRRSGDNRRAIEEYRHGIDTGRGMLGGHPDDAELLYAQAKNSLQLADALSTDGRMDAAIATLNDVVELDRHIVAADPLNTRALSHLALALMRSGDSLAEKQEYESGRSRLLEAIEVYRKLLQITPDDPAAQKMLSLSYNQLAELEARRQHFDESVKARQQSIDLVMPLLKASPDDPLLLGGLAFLYRGLGRSLVGADRPSEAISPLREALALDHRVTAMTPTDDRAALNLLFSQDTLAEALSDVATSEAALAGERISARSEARNLLVKCRDEYVRRREAGTLSGDLSYKPDDLEHRIRDLDAAGAASTTQPLSSTTTRTAD